DSFERNMLFYYENEWAPLSVIMSTPFVFQIFKAQVKPMLIFVTFTAIFGVRFAYIIDSSKYFHQRLENLTAITDKLYQEQTYKAVIKAEDQYANEYLVMNWSTPIESMMLSKIKGYQPAVSFKIVPNDFNFRQLTDSFYSN